MSMALFSLSNISDKKIRRLSSLVKIVDMASYKNYQILHKHIIENDYNTKYGMRKIFELAIQDLNLNNQLYT